MSRDSEPVSQRAADDSCRKDEAAPSLENKCLASYGAAKATDSVEAELLPEASGKEVSSTGTEEELSDNQKALSVNQEVPSPEVEEPQSKEEQPTSEGAPSLPAVPLNRDGTISVRAFDVRIYAGLASHGLDDEKLAKLFRSARRGPIHVRTCRIVETAYLI